MDITPAVLRNRGVPVTMFMRDRDGKPVQPAEPDDDQPTEQVWIKFNSNHIADIEDIFGHERTDLRTDDGQVVSVPRDPNEVLSERSRNQPQRTVRTLLAIALEAEELETGELMIPSRIDEYSTAIGVAYSLAQGVDPALAKKVLDHGLANPMPSVVLVEKRLRAAIEEIEADGTPGTSGSEPGPVPAEEPTSSGA